MSVIIIKKENFENEVKKSTIPVLLDFYADWCGPCKMLSPIIEKIAEENSDIRVGKINVDEQMELAQAFNVASIPTLVVIKDGKVINKATGYRSEESILELLKG